MYYGLIILSVAMFGACFALNDQYRKLRGSGLRISLEFSFFGSLAGLIVLLCVNGFRPIFTPFTLIMALLWVLVSLGFTFCGFKALGSINLSLYSLFSMLGGMMLPFLQGIIFYKEPLTVAKALCFALICISLWMTVERDKKHTGWIYYIGIFTLNGLCGVLSKLFNTLPFEKTDASGYSILIALCTLVISAALLPFVKKDPKNDTKTTPASIGVAAAQGLINRVANLLLVIALLHVDTSVQYPMVTGGVMIVSTLICFFGKNKPKKKELIAVLIAFVGMLLLFILPF